MSANEGDLRPIIQKWCPVVSFHPKERFFCCTPEWYAERCKLIRFLEGGKQKPTVLANSEISVKKINDITANKPNFRDEFRLVLSSKNSRVGQVDAQFKDIPVFCHLKRVKLPDENILLEINYIFCFAYNGPYRVAGVNTGMHDGDWEHITVRCTEDGHLVAVYYGAHRHGDGTWKAAKDCPVDRETGRLLAYVTFHGHGLYPTTGVHARVFLAANDVTADSGRRWGCQECIVLASPGEALASGDVTLDKLPPPVEVEGAAFTEPYKEDLKNIIPSRRLTYEQKVRRAAADAANDQPVPVEYVQVITRATQWLRWKVRWGTITPPQEQDWYKKAEHPTGNSTLGRTLTPCVRP